MSEATSELYLSRTSDVPVAADANFSGHDSEADIQVAPSDSANDRECRELVEELEQRQHERRPIEVSPDREPGTLSRSDLEVSMWYDTGSQLVADGAADGVKVVAAGSVKTEKQSPPLKSLPSPARSGPPSSAHSPVRSPVRSTASSPVLSPVPFHSPPSRASRRDAYPRTSPRHACDMAERREHLRESSEPCSSKHVPQGKRGFCWSSLSAAATAPRRTGSAGIAYPPSPPRASLAFEEQTQATRDTPGLGGIDCEGAGSGSRSSPREKCKARSESAAEVYSKAECLCEIGKFRQAVPLFKQVISALHGSADARLGLVEAEVWAHLGVTMQSLDDIEAAIDSYRKALELDPSLHVCFANLATLYSYMGDGKNAQENIQRALELIPGVRPTLKFNGRLLRCWLHHPCIDSGAKV